jgi:cold shock CspA family protein
MFGTVTKYFREKGYGFIRGEDGNSYFIHKSKLQGEYIERGYYVFFRPFVSDRSDYNAADISVIDAQERNRQHGKGNK